MGKSRRDPLQKVVSLLELPGDVVLDVPRLTLVGDVELSVENHRGLLAFSEHHVVLGTPRGPLTVRGDTLSIGLLSPEQMLIRGKIHSLQYQE